MPGGQRKRTTYSLALHYRHAQRRRAARTALLNSARGVPGLRVFGGKSVINIVAAGAPDKGDALVCLLGRVRATAVLYVGDDETDENVFRAKLPAPLLGIRIAAASGSDARYFLRGQRDVDRLLARLVELNPGSAVRL